MTNEEIRLRAAELIEAKGWTRQYMARNVAGQPVLFSDDDAACFCLLGAIERAAHEYYGTPISSMKVVWITVELKEKYKIFSLASWNDEPSRKKEEVVALLRGTYGR